MNTVQKHWSRIALCATVLGVAVGSRALSQTARLRQLLGGEEATPILSLAFSPDGNHLAVGGSVAGPKELPKHLRIWDVASGKASATFEGHPFGVTAVRFSPDGKTLASAGQHVKLGDVASGKNLFALIGHSGAVYCVAFSPDGRTLASGGTDGTVVLWDVASGKNTASFKAHLARGVRALAYSPDGKILASGGLDRTVKLWNANSAKLLDAREAHPFGVWCLAFSRDGKMLFSGGVDKTSKSGAGPRDGAIRLWKTGTLSEVATLEGHTSSVFTLAVSPDGKILVSGSKDKTVRVWNIPERRCSVVLTGHTGSVSGVAFSPDGKSLASGGTDKAIRIWNLE